MQMPTEMAHLPCLCSSFALSLPVTWDATGCIAQSMQASCLQGSLRQSMSFAAHSFAEFNHRSCAKHFAELGNVFLASACVLFCTQ